MSVHDKPASGAGPLDPLPADQSAFSRRAFLKTVGVGPLAAGVLAPGAAEAQPAVREVGPGAVAIELTVNGTRHALSVEPRVTLLDALRTRLGIGAAPLVLTVARLVPHKGQDVAIRAIAALGESAGDTHYALVGEGDDAPRLRALAESLGLGARVHLTGALSDDEIAEAYATADVYVGLSRVDSAINAEGFGISFVEASASGTPCIAGDSGGVRSAVRDGETGFVITPTDQDAVTAALRRLLGDAALRTSMGIAGRRAVESHYNWDRVARETLDFTRSCLSSLRRE
jgi:phosphatidylinositol alpha-1,6-mannosyltransferase